VDTIALDVQVQTGIPDAAKGDRAITVVVPRAFGALLQSKDTSGRAQVLVAQRGAAEVDAVRFAHVLRRSAAAGAV